jgi:RimJ/RimL family protein N-acetyltransferase
MEECNFSKLFPDLILRPASEHDQAALHAILNIPQVMQAYFGRLHGDRLIADYLSSTLNPCEKINGSSWVIANRGGEKAAVGLVKFSDGRLSYLLAPTNWRHGVMYQALARLLVAQTLPLTAVVHRSNTPSVRLLEKLGAQFDRLSYEEGAFPALREPWLHFRLHEIKNMPDKRGAAASCPGA